MKRNRSLYPKEIRYLMRLTSLVTKLRNRAQRNGDTKEAQRYQEILDSLPEPKTTW